MQFQIKVTRFETCISECATSSLEYGISVAWHNVNWFHSQRHLSTSPTFTNSSISLAESSQCDCCCCSSCTSSSYSFSSWLCKPLDTSMEIAILDPAHPQQPWTGCNETTLSPIVL